MTMVRQTLGEDAIIVATREENGGKTVRVTAAVEQYDADDYEAPEAARGAGPFFEIDTVDEPQTGARAWLQYDDENEENAVIEQLTDVMLRHAVPDEIVDHVISCATVIGASSAPLALTAAFEHLYSFRPLPQKAMRSAHMLVGPPGAGKTLAVAKLAARGVMAGLRVGVITADTIRAGGVEQLAAFTKILRIDLKKVNSPQTLRAALEEMRGLDQIFIDTPGYNPFAPEEMRDLARLGTAGDVEPVLVLPAAFDADESGEMGRIYATLGVRAVVPTRLDIARRLGGLLSAAHHGGLIFSDASNTPKVADGLIPLSPRSLTGLLMPETRADTSSSSRTPSSATSSPRRRQTA